MISLKADKLILALIDSVGKSTDADAISNSWKELEDYIEQLEESLQYWLSEMLRKEKDAAIK